MHDVLAVERVIRGLAIDILFYAQAIVVIGELRIGAGLDHVVQHAACLPRERPAVVLSLSRSPFCEHVLTRSVGICAIPQKIWIFSMKSGIAFALIGTYNKKNWFPP